MNTPQSPQAQLQPNNWRITQMNESQRKFWMRFVTESDLMESIYGVCPHRKAFMENQKDCKIYKSGTASEQEVELPEFEDSWDAITPSTPKH